MITEPYCPTPASTAARSRPRRCRPTTVAPSLRWPDEGEGPAGSRRAARAFRGPPGRLAALFQAVSAGPVADREATATLKGVAPRLAVRPLARGEVSGLRATLRLPATTPPGNYQGVARIAGRELPIAVEVEPYARTRSHPSRLEVEAGPGSEVAVELMLVNEGNVPLELPSRSSFCLFEGDGIHHALWAALTSDPPAGKQRVDLLLDDLADSHGGLVDVRPSAPPAPIAPGATQAVRLSLRFSDRLRAGHEYSGSWEPAGLRLPLRVSVPTRARSRVQRRRPHE